MRSFSFKKDRSRLAERADNLVTIELQRRTYKHSNGDLTAGFLDRDPFGRPNAGALVLKLKLTIVGIEVGDDSAVRERSAAAFVYFI
jgi:hypothetical protein